MGGAFSFFSFRCNLLQNQHPTRLGERARSDPVVVHSARQGTGIEGDHFGARLLDFVDEYRHLPSQDIIDGQHDPGPRRDQIWNCRDRVERVGIVLTKRETCRYLSRTVVHTGCRNIIDDARITRMGADKWKRVRPQGIMNLDIIVDNLVADRYRKTSSHRIASYVGLPGVLVRGEHINRKSRRGTVDLHESLDGRVNRVGYHVLVDAVTVAQHRQNEVSYT